MLITHGFGCGVSYGVGNAPLGYSSDASTIPPAPRSAAASP